MWKGDPPAIVVYPTCVIISQLTCLNCCCWLSFSYPYVQCHGYSVQKLLSHNLLCHLLHSGALTHLLHHKVLQPNSHLFLCLSLAFVADLKCLHYISLFISYLLKRADISLLQSTASACGACSNVVIWLPMRHLLTFRLGLHRARFVLK